MINYCNLQGIGWVFIVTSCCTAIGVLYQPNLCKLLTSRVSLRVSKSTLPGIAP